MAYFLAIVPEGLKENQEVVRLVSKFKRTMNDRSKEVRWVASDLWHVTIQYLGKLNDYQKAELISFLNEWKPGEAWQDIELRLSGIGAFPEEDHARILWLGVQRNQSLLDAQAELKQQIQAYIQEDDGRDFKPHLTLARFRNAMSASELVQLGGRKHFGDYPVTELILFESVLQGNMNKYIPIVRKKFNQV